MSKYTKQEDDFLRSNYLTMPAKKMAVALGRPKGSARQRMKVLGLTVPVEIIKQFNEQSHFKKGSMPHTYNKKQHEYMSAAAIKSSSHTRFKKGQVPHNKLFDGKITVRKNTMSNGVIKKYKWIRIAPEKWRHLHIVKWEQAFGPVPAGMIVAFKDRDSMNVELSNLELITKEENMSRNTIHKYPLEIKQSIRTLSKLNRKIKNHEEQIS